MVKRLNFTKRKRVVVLTSTCTIDTTYSHTLYSIIVVLYHICYLNSSANAYMLVYRMINSERNTGMLLLAYTYLHF